MEVNGQLESPAALLSRGKKPSVGALGGPHSQSGSGDEKKENRESNLGRPARSLITILIDFSRLHWLEMITILMSQYEILY
jgi:hypothetical protein